MRVQCSGRSHVSCAHAGDECWYMYVIFPVQTDPFVVHSGFESRTFSASFGTDSHVLVTSCASQIHVDAFPRFQKSILLIVEYKYLKSCSGDFVLQNLILHTRSCVTGFITQSSWVFHFHLTIMVRWKFFVRQLYQFRRGISGGPALKYFYMMHRGGRTFRC